MTKEIIQWMIAFGGEPVALAFFCFPTQQLAQNIKDSQSLIFMPYQEKKISIMKESLFGTKFKQVFRNYLAR